MTPGGATMALVDVDAERALLGAALLSSTVLPIVLVEHRLAAEDFGRESHARIFRAMLELHDAGAPVDALTVSRKASVEYLELDAIAGETPAAANAVHYAAIVKRTALRRRWQQAAVALLDAAERDDDARAENAERILAHGAPTDDTYDQERLAAEVESWFQRTEADLTSGFVEFDDILGGGLHPGDTSLVAAWEAMGKSVLVWQWLALNRRQGKRVHLYSNDTPVRDLALRGVAHAGAARWSSIARRRLTDEQARRVLKASHELPFHVTDTSDYDVWTAAQIARHIRVNRWDVCAVDVLHNMPYRDESDLRLIASTLKNAAQSVGCHLILVCHLNQERAKSETLPPPVRRDLRGSGMLAKLAANVLFLHRPQTVDDLGGVDTSLFATLTADKARHGNSGSAVELFFEPQRMRFRLPTPADRDGVFA